MRQWVDEATGRQVRQLTDEPGGVVLDYFRQPKHLPGGLVLGVSQTNCGDLWFLEPDSGEVQRRNLPITRRLRLRGGDGRMWYVGRTWRDVWAVVLPDGEPRLIAEVPEEVRGSFIDITCDGRMLITGLTEDSAPQLRVPLTKDVEAFWRYIDRPRKGLIWAYDLIAGAVTELAISENYGFGHHDSSPMYPQLLKFSSDYYDALCQRIWTVHTDGTGLTKIRPQEAGEFVTHEFWWPNGQAVGYTYQDRRKDSSLRELPWGEYACVPTQYGIANLDGKEIYLSDPLNHYHSHLYVSPDANWAIGDGTEEHSFVYAAPLSLDDSRLDLQPLATVHTPYVPFAGQAVDATMTPGNRWMLYNDTIGLAKQICAVRVD